MMLFHIIEVQTEKSVQQHYNERTSVQTKLFFSYLYEYIFAIAELN